MFSRRHMLAISLVETKCIFSLSAMNWNTGDFIVFGAESGKLYLWDAATLNSLTVVKAHSSKKLLSLHIFMFFCVGLFSGAITTIDLSDDSRTLVTGSQDKNIAIWNITSS